MPNISPKIQRFAFTMRVDDEFEDDLEELRKLIKPIPSKSEAVRIAVTLAVGVARQYPDMVRDVIKQQ